MKNNGWLVIPIVIFNALLMVIAFPLIVALGLIEMVVRVAESILLMSEWTLYKLFDD